MDGTVGRVATDRLHDGDAAGLVTVGGHLGDDLAAGDPERAGQPHPLRDRAPPRDGRTPDDATDEELLAAARAVLPRLGTDSEPATPEAASRRSAASRCSAGMRATSCMKPWNSSCSTLPAPTRVACMRSWR